MGPTLPPGWANRPFIGGISYGVHAGATVALLVYIMALQGREADRLFEYDPSSMVTAELHLPVVVSSRRSTRPDR
jgi:hypothetical protein